MCVGPPAFIMSLPWQRETGPGVPLKHCQTLWPRWETVPLFSSSSSSQWENERKVAMTREWTALSYWGCMYFNSTLKFFFSFFVFFQCQVLLISVLSSSAVVWSFKGWRGKLIGSEADCKYVFLPVAVDVWTLLAKAFFFNSYVKSVQLESLIEI